MIIDNLITDRNAADLARKKALAAKGWQNMTAAEKAEWLTALKGAYNAEDLNRVGKAVNYLKADFDALPSEIKTYLFSIGVAPDAFYNVPFAVPIDVNARENWANSEMPTSEELAEYLDNVRTMRDAWELTSPLPASMQMLTISGANNIEKALVDAYNKRVEWTAEKKEWADKAAQTFVYCGQSNCGMIWEEFEA